MAPTSSTDSGIPHMESLVFLGRVLRSLDNGQAENNAEILKSLSSLEKSIEKASRKNPWFTVAHCKTALGWWGELLTESAVQTWLSAYKVPAARQGRIALIMAGNIPGVGLHDLLSVLVTGHQALVKCSSKDDILLPALVEILATQDGTIQEKVIWAEGLLPEHDGVIATGSNNTSRYFEYYFGKKPHIIRKNRNAVAVLNGTETKEELSLLADDLFLYFGLGCRNVSKLYLPPSFDPAAIVDAASSYQHFMTHTKYANNYAYYKALYLMGNRTFHDGDFCLFLEEEQIASPIGTIHYEYYRSIDDLNIKLGKVKDQIQCIVAQSRFPGEVGFGHAQKPGLDSYADGVDTVEFLLKTSFK